MLARVAGVRCLVSSCHRPGPHPGREEEEGEGPWDDTCGRLAPVLPLEAHWNTARLGIITPGQGCRSPGGG